MNDQHEPATSVHARRLAVSRYRRRASYALARENNASVVEKFERNVEKTRTKTHDDPRTAFVRKLIEQGA